MTATSNWQLQLGCQLRFPKLYNPQNHFYFYDLCSKIVSRGSWHVKISWGEVLSIWDKQSIIISFVFGREKWMSKSCRTVWVGQNFRTNWIVWRRAYNFPPLACAALPCHEVPWGGLPKKWSNWNSEELERSTGPNLEGEIVSKPVLHRHRASAKFSNPKENWLFCGTHFSDSLASAARFMGIPSPSVDFLMGWGKILPFDCSDIERSLSPWLSPLMW